VTALSSLEDARSQWRTDTVRLSDGLTAYHLEGASDRPCVVLVHGILTPGFAFEDLSRALVSAGFRVLYYDAFGRGLSDRPRVRYDQALYLRQLHELTEALGMRSAHFVGWSMGGVITCNHALAHPEQVKSLVLIAPGLFLTKPRLLALVHRLPGADRLIARNVSRFIAALPGQQFREPWRFAAFSERAFVQARFEGLGASFASSVRHYPWRTGSELAEVGKHGRPVLVIWGKRDPTTPYANAARVCAVFPRAELFTLDRAKHAPQLEYAEQVHPKIVSFLRAAEAEPVKP
jgi:pimeloyl-ACP methyl ester carboxylesterase